MSVYYWLVCPETKKKIFVGRNTQDTDRISISEECPLGPFLAEHINKPLLFLSEFDFEDGKYRDCVEVDWLDYQVPPLSHGA